MPPSLTQLVLYVADLDRSHRFYADLGLHLLADTRSEHGRRFSAQLGGETVLELRSCGDGPPTRTALGFAVPDPARTAELLNAVRYPVIYRRGMSLTARDPDGNTVDLTLAED